MYTIIGEVNHPLRAKPSPIRLDDTDPEAVIEDFSLPEHATRALGEDWVWVATLDSREAEPELDEGLQAVFLLQEAFTRFGPLRAGYHASAIGSLISFIPLKRVSGRIAQAQVRVTENEASYLITSYFVLQGNEGAFYKQIVQELIGGLEH
jgi:hypothetical protein